MTQNIDASKALEDQREFDLSVLIVDPRQTQNNAYSASQPIEGSSGTSTTPVDCTCMAQETFSDTGTDPFVSYFSDWDPNTAPKVLITSPKAAEVRYNFGEELVDFFPGAAFIRRKKGECPRQAGLWGGPRTEDFRNFWRLSECFVLPVYGVSIFP